MNIISSKILLFCSAFSLTTICVHAQGGDKGGSKSDVPTTKVGGIEPTKEGWLPSITPDGGFDRVTHVGKPIPWQRIREADILWRKRVWREIDIREKQNIAFRYEGDENTGGGMFIEILLDYVKKGKIAAYSSFGNDDRFTQKLTKEQIMEKLAPKIDTVLVESPETGEMIKTPTQRDFHPENIVVFKVKEDWIFDRNMGRMVVRITGIAPVIDLYGDNGEYKGPQTMFWLYYPEMRQMLSNYEVYNPNNDMHRPTWDEFFEQRMFSSKITKISNSLNKRFEDIYGTDQRGKMEMLYESQKSAEELFNKEHDMWVY
ncbi:MAG: gliding motility protein GldN [Chitinophagia bacterium]|nr:gliding motility protein GldN [Chitinophagia bacterium]